MQTVQYQGFIKSFSFHYDDHRRFLLEGEGNRYFRFNIFEQEDYFWFNTAIPTVKEWIKAIIVCYHQKKVLHFSYQIETKEVMYMKI